MDDAVTVRDLEGRIVLANARRASTCRCGRGADRDALPSSALRASSTPTAQMHDRDLPWIRAAGGRARGALLVRRVERATGEQQWLLIKATPIRDATAPVASS